MFISTVVFKHDADTGIQPAALSESETAISKNGSLRYLCAYPYRNNEKHLSTNPRRNLHVLGECTSMQLTCIISKCLL